MFNTCGGVLREGSPHEIPRDPGARPSRSHPAHVPRPRGLARWLLCLARSARKSSGDSQSHPPLDYPGASTERPVRPTAVPASGMPWSSRGPVVGTHRIARLMRAEGIRAKTVKQWRATTQSAHRLPEQRPPFIASSRCRIPTGCGLEIAPPCGPRRAGSTWPCCSICTHASWVEGRGPAVDRGAGRAGPPHGAHEPTPQRGAAAPLRSRQPICRHERPAGAHHSRHHAQHEPQRPTAGTTRASKVSLGCSRGSSCSIGTTPRGTKRRRTFSRAVSSSKCHG